jgi:hypothetical protein
VTIESRTKRRLAVAFAGLTLAACATRGTEMYAMPADPAHALAPGEADPGSAAELAESALHLLGPERPGGPDYLGAARMCLLAADAAEPGVEDPLARACYRVAARSALHAGDRETYLEAVERWARNAPRTERATGELAFHLAIRDRLVGDGASRYARVPPELRRLLPPPGTR